MKLYFWFVFCLLIFAIACERPVDLNIEAPSQKLVVISNFSPTQALQVEVSQARSVLNTEQPNYIKNAVVDVYENAEFMERLQLINTDPESPPYYASKYFVPKEKTLYTIQVEAPGFESVRAESSIPQRIDIERLTISEVNAFFEKNNHLIYTFRVAINFKDPKEEENYYHLNFYQQVLKYEVTQNDTLITGSYFRRVEFSPETDNNSFIAYFDGGTLFEDKPFNGKFITYSFQSKSYIYTDKELLGDMFVELRTTSKEYYLFHNSLSRQQTSPSGPFTEPVIIFNNIQNGSGIFAGYNFTVSSAPVRR